MDLTVGGQQKNQSLREAEQHCGAAGPPFKIRINNKENDYLMAFITKEQAVHIVVNCAQKYQKNLSGNSLLFFLLDKHSGISPLEVYFHQQNFLHLTVFQNQAKTKRMT